MDLTLVIMAAGMGSRYGGVKQIDKIGPNGEMILELSCYDGIKAGFKRIVFIIRKEIKEQFEELLGNKLSKIVDVNYVIQEEYNFPDGRVKPWGTAHAILCAKNIVKSPFVVINADDYYGQQGFILMFNFLKNNNDEKVHAMIGYNLYNTLSNNGYVSRAVCTIKDNYLIDIKEMTEIVKREEKAYYIDCDKKIIELDCDGVVSMNIWGFMPSIFNELESGFIKFFDNQVQINPLLSEYYIPSIVSELLNDDKIRVKVIETKDKWYGITYKEDKPVVAEFIKQMINRGLYPKNLWSSIKDNY